MTINFGYSNVTIYSSQEISSNLTVDGSIVASNAVTVFGVTTLSNDLTVYGQTSLSNAVWLSSNLTVNGATTLSNDVSIYSPTTLYNSYTDQSVLTFSNSTGATALSSSNAFLGVHTGVGSNPQYTLDVNGDINFNGVIYQNGAVFSGWNSNSFGNYINSNAAFKGQTTADDVMLLYTYPGIDTESNLAFSFSNSSGKTSLYSLSNSLGLGTSNPDPRVALDVAGGVHADGGFYANSNEAYFLGLDSNCLMAVAGNFIATSNIVAQSSIGVGTLTPTYPIDVVNSSNGISIHCTAKVVATEFSVYSDRRIKTDVTSRDAEEYLSALNALPVKEFAYVDGFDKGVGKRIGFLAQEVEAILPSCVETVSDFVPNVFAALPIAPPAAGADALETNHVVLSLAGLDADVQALLVPGAELKCRSGIKHGRTAAGVVVWRGESEQQIRVKFVSGPVPAADDGGAIFVVGTMVHDFKMLNHERLNSIAIGAIQAQHARLLALEAALQRVTLQLQAAPKSGRGCVVA
jgi:hypothetical protein